MNSIKKETKRILKACSWEIILKFVISAFYRGSLLIIPIIWGKIVDYATIQNFPASYKMIILAVGVMLFCYLSACLNQVFYYRLYNKMYKLYSKLAYSSFINNSIHSISRFKISEFNNIINNDIDIIVAFFSDTIIKIIQIMEFLIIYYYFYSINIVMFIVTVVVSLTMVLVLCLLNIKTGKLNAKRKDALDKKTSITHEVFNTVKEIKGFYVFRSVNDRVKEKCSDYLKAHSSLNSYSVIIKQIVFVFIELARYSLIAYGVYLFSVEKMEIGMLLVIYTYYAKIIENYEIIGTLTSGIQDAKVSMKRFNKLIEYRSVGNSLNSINKVDYIGNISFENVLYGDRKDPILNNVSFSIAANSISVITGPTGAGKTGVLDLLMKMNKKHDGNILIDDIPYEKIGDNTFYNLISLVRKEPNFFDLSIKENLMLVSKNFEDVQDVCKSLGIHEEIMTLSKGYDTDINSPSAKISFNLKRGIAIARVILKNSKIIMFDEILDTLESELRNRVLTMLNKMKKDHTIIIISRESHILKIADKVIKLDNNKVSNEQAKSH